MAKVSGAYAGTLGISIRNLNTGEARSIRGHATFPSASLIKLPLLITLMTVELSALLPKGNAGRQGASPAPPQASKMSK